LGSGFSFEFRVVIDIVAEEFGRGAVECERDIFTYLVASLFNGKAEGI
jgi:hypothetical protein